MTKKMIVGKNKVGYFTNDLTSVLQVRLPEHEKDQFLQVCKDLDTTAARELRLFIREFLKKNAQGKLL